MPAWPISKPSPTIPPPAPVTPSEVSALKDELRTVNTRLNEVLALLKSGALIQASPVHIPSTVPVLAPHVYISDVPTTRPQERITPVDPIFIPSRIVPDKADVHINAQEEQSSGDGFDVSLDALKKLRKR
jgi:hypothetical protein